MKPTADFQMEEEQQAQFRVKVRQKRLRVTHYFPTNNEWRPDKPADTLNVLQKLNESMKEKKKTSLILWLLACCWL